MQPHDASLKRHKIKARPTDAAGQPGKSDAGDELDATFAALGSDDSGTLTRAQVVGWMKTQGERGAMVRFF